MTIETMHPATIFALSSAPGRAGVAIVRVSGSQAGMVLNVMAPKRPKPRMAGGRSILHPKTGEALDRGIVLWFPGPNSFTGEDVAELQLHGGRAVVASVLSALGEIPGLRMAEPGEFARRAFDNGKIDLAQAEGLADLIDAETQGQRRQALRQAGGALSSLYEGWRRSLIDASALVEAAIDFSDEPDVEARSVDQARAIVETLAKAIRQHLDDGHRGEIMRDGFHVVLTGAPNVGKSSLLNVLAKRDAAIVSDEAGTTRDIIEVRLDLSGVPVIVSDTAGLREAPGKVEQEGMRRSIERAQAADLVIWLTDAAEVQMALPEELQARPDKLLRVINKIDLIQEEGAASLDQTVMDLGSGVPAGGPIVMPDDTTAISVRDGTGLAGLIERLGGIAKERAGSGEDAVITQTRHRSLIEACLHNLETFLAGPSHQTELRAEDLRASVTALGKITGRVDVEDVLDQVFGRFCIGK